MTSARCSHRDFGLLRRCRRPGSAGKGDVPCPDAALWRWIDQSLFSRASRLPSEALLFSDYSFRCVRFRSAHDAIAFFNLKNIIEAVPDHPADANHGQNASPLEALQSFHRTIPSPTETASREEMF